MAKVTVQKTADIDDWIRQLVAKIEKVADVAVTETVDQSKVVMKQMIASRGTNKPWSGYFEGRSGRLRNHSGVGRIDSGAMINSVDSQMIIDTRSHFEGEFGWINGDTNGYFVLQENGFYNYLANAWIEPMNALRDSFTQAKYLVVNKITEGIKKI